MADRPGSGVAPWDELLIRVVQAIAQAETASTEQIVQTLADQPFAARPVWREDGVAGPHRIFMGLVSGAAPLALGTTTVVPSWGSMANAVYVGGAPPPEWFPRDGFVIKNVGGLLMGDVDDARWLEPAPIRDDLRAEKRALVDLVAYDQHGDTSALKRAKEYVHPRWDEVVKAPPDPETGQGQVWIGGVQAACAHAGMVVLRRPSLRARFRVCPKCGALRYTSQHVPGPISEFCPGHGPGDAARDKRKDLREALQAAGCPGINAVASAILSWCPSVTDLRDAASRGETRLMDTVRAAARAHLRAQGLPAKDRDIEQLVTGVSRRLREPAVRRRSASGRDAWAMRAFEELGLWENRLPTDAEVHAAYEEMIQRRGATTELREAREDALVFLRARRGGTRR